MSNLFPLFAIVYSEPMKRPAFDGVTLSLPVKTVLVQLTNGATSLHEAKRLAAMNALYDQS